MILTFWKTVFVPYLKLCPLVFTSFSVKPYHCSLRQCAAICLNFVTTRTLSLYCQIYFPLDLESHTSHMQCYCMKLSSCSYHPQFIQAIIEYMSYCTIFHSKVSCWIHITTVKTPQGSDLQVGMVWVEAVSVFLTPLFLASLRDSYSDYRAGSASRKAVLELLKFITQMPSSYLQFCSCYIRVWTVPAVWVGKYCSHSNIRYPILDHDSVQAFSGEEECQLTHFNQQKSINFLEQRPHR